MINTSPKKTVEFHAQPVPNFSRPMVTKIAPKKLTIPQTPNLLKRYQLKTEPFRQKENSKPSTKNSNTRALPFSFEARNNALREKREAFVRKVYAEEQKAREFHARPVPKAILKVVKNTSNGVIRNSQGNTEGRSSFTVSYNDITYIFLLKRYNLFMCCPDLTILLFYIMNL